MNLVQIFKQNKKETFLLGLIISIAIFLRFYQINKLHFFTYDQARDAIYVKRIIVDGKLRLLGTQTSLPGMYLPPFYYYTIAPILWLFRLNPIGIDIYSATIGVLAILLIFFVANQMFGRPAGIVAAAIYSVSPLNVELSRRAWNPNTLPFFILLAFYFLWRAFKDNQGRDFLFASIVYGYCLSLHFGAWTLAPIFLFSWLFFWRKNKDKRVIFGSAAAIIFFILPLLLFELRHHFFLLSQAKTFFFDEQHLSLPAAGFLESFIASIFAIFTVLLSGRILVGSQAPFEFSGRLKDLFRFSQPISVVAQKTFSLSFQWWGVLLLSLIVAFSAWFLFEGKEKRQRLSLRIIWAWVLAGILVSQFYAGKFFFFYYLFLFPVPFLLLGFLAERLWRKKWLRGGLVVAMIAMVAFHLLKTTIFQPNWRDFDDLKGVAGVIAENVSEESFNIATIRRDTDFWERNSVDYRYFVETYEKKRALDWHPEDYQRAETLFVVDETGKADVLATNIMEIQVFNPEKIVGQWPVGKGIIVYRLTKKR